METTTTGNDRQQNEQKDLISCLGDDLLIRIIDGLSTLEAARTMTLSKRWRPLFSRIPTLCFDGRLCRYDTILGILNARDGFPVASCLVFLNYRESNKEGLENVISSLCRHAVKNLSLVLVHPVPSRLFSCDSLEKLNLVHCSIVVSQNLVSLPRLKYLQLVDVQIENDWLETTIPLCGCLENLHVHGWTKFNLVIRSKSLSCVRFLGSPKMRNVSFKEATSLRELEIAPDLRLSISDVSHDSELLLGFLSRIENVETLSITCTKISSQVLTQMTNQMPEKVILHNLKKLALKIDMSKFSTNSFISCLLQQCSNLEVLRVENCSEGVLDCPQNLLSFWETQKATSFLSHLRWFAITSANDNDKSISAFVQFLSRNGMVLETMTIHQKEESKTQMRTYCRRCRDARHM